MQATVEYVDGSTEELTILADDYKHLAVGISVRGADKKQRLVAADKILSLTTERDGFYRQVDFVNRSPGIPRKVVKKLARRLVEGEASLYRLDLLAGEKFVLLEGKDGGIHTYYLAVGEEIAELREEESVKKGTEYRKDDRYLGVLKYLLQSCERVTARFEYEDIEYSDVDLVQLVKEYNACGNDNSTPEAENIEKTTSYVFEGIFARAGGLRDKRYENIPASDAAFGGLSVGIRAPRISRRTSLNLAVDLYRNNDTIAFDRRRVVTPVLSATRVVVFAEQDLIDPRYLVRPFALAGFAYEHSANYGFENTNIVKFHVGVGVKTDFLKLTLFNESIKQWNAAATVRLWPLPWRGKKGSE